MMSHLAKMGSGACEFLFVGSEIVMLFCLLLALSMIILRCRLIFVWKRVHGFDDSFIAR